MHPASNASAEANVRLSMPWCANSPRHALQKTRIVIDYDHERRLRHHIRVQSRGVHGPSGGRPILDLDQWNLDRHEPHDERIVACRGTGVGQGADAGWCGLRKCTSVDVKGFG